MDAKPPQRLIFDRFEIEPGRHSLTRDGVSVHLPRKPYHVLLYLIENRERTVSRDELLNQFWEGHEVYEASLTKCIGNIRKALDDSHGEPKYIQTQWAEGYRFIYPVGECVDSVEIESMRGVQISVEETVENRSSLRSILNQRTALVFGSAMTLAVFAIIIYLWANQSGAGVARSSFRSLAVLPIKNATGDAANDYICDGVTERLIASFSRIDELKVIASGSVLGYKESDLDPVAIGRRLGVETILTGSLLRNGEYLQITAKLLNARDGSVIWAGETSKRDVKDIFALHDEVTRETTRVLRGNSAVNLVRSEVPYTNDSEAYRLYLQGRYFWNKRTAEGLNKGIQYFEKATELDPQFALAYAGLADCYSLLSYYSAARPDETFPRAKVAATKALQLDDSLAEAHASMGIIVVWYDLDWMLADREYRRAIELNPNYATARHWYGNLLVLRGRGDESIAELQKAYELDPLSPAIGTDLGMAYFFARRYDEAISQLGKVLELDQNYAMAHYFMAWSFQQRSEFDKAVSEFEKAVELSPEKAETLAMLTQAYAAAGQTDKAQKNLAILKKRFGQDNRSPFALALAYKGLGHRESALQALEISYKERDAGLVELTINPLFDDLRTDPRFVAIVKRVGL